MEEEEAKAIQQRLLGQLEDVDFTMGMLDKVCIASCLIPLNKMVFEK